MKQLLLVLSFFLIILNVSWSQCSGMLIIGMQGDNPDILTLQATANIAGGTVYHFTDNEWIAADEAFNNLFETEHSWTAPVGGITSGSIIQITGTTATCGTVTGTPTINPGTEIVYLLSVAPSDVLNSVTVADICFAVETASVDGDIPAGKSVDVGNFDNTAYNGSGDITDASNWTSSNSAVTPPTPNCIIMPVDLLDFTAKAVDQTALLSFTTASEENNSHFLIQHSGDGKVFETIGRIEGKGYSNQEVNYQYTDTKPLPGMNYYRLQQFDYDGTNEFFGPIAVRFDALDTDQPRIWPVPAKDRLEVSLPSGDNHQWLIEIYDLNGRRLLQSSLDEKTTVTSLDISAFPAGSYFFRWVNNQQSGQLPFIKG